MPSSLNLFIRVHKSASTDDIAYAVNCMDMCRIMEIKLKKGKVCNNATVFVDYWFRGTRKIREMLINGTYVYIPNQIGESWMAFEHKPQHATVAKTFNPYGMRVLPFDNTIIPCSSGPVDEFGRDISHRRLQPLPIAPALLSCDVLPPFVTDNRAERARKIAKNKKYSNVFIDEYGMPPKKSVQFSPTLEIVPSMKCWELPVDDKLSSDMRTPTLVPRSDVLAERCENDIRGDDINGLATKLDVFVDTPTRENLSYTDASDPLNDHSDTMCGNERRPRQRITDFDTPTEGTVCEFQYTISAPVKKRVIKVRMPKLCYH
jgi:hypothetical protein